MANVVVDEKTVGITATVPSEIIFAAGWRPLDLNNVFITSDDPARYIEIAERRGFPSNLCAWIKGIYGVVTELGLRTVVGLTQGDCSNTLALMEVLSSEGVETIGFAYPHGRDPLALRGELERFQRRFGVTNEQAARMKERLDAVRSLIHDIDALNWRDAKVSGAESFLWHISTSDFAGDFDSYAARARLFLDEAKLRPGVSRRFRLAVTGIPPIANGFHAALESFDARVVFDEIPRQFSMPYPTRTLTEQYARFTYPYDVFGRIEDIASASGQRRFDGIVHYVQSFCYRGIEARLISESLDVPVLTLEFDRPGPVDGRSRTRIEAFMEMLEARRDRV